MACPVRCLVRGPRSTSLTRPLILTDSSSASPLDLHLPTTITSSHPPGRGPRPRQRQRGYAGRRRQAAKDPGRRIRPDAHLDRREGEGDRFGAAAGGLSRGRRVLHHLQHHGRVGTRIPMPGDPPPPVPCSSRLGLSLRRDTGIQRVRAVWVNQEIAPADTSPNPRRWLPVLLSSVYALNSPSPLAPVPHILCHCS